ncbi:uncharacterized protein LOC134267783 [Saccostrea cucullata]|uniref:uncharacterized protein LOC134267783 n=1 Tax=Saccostrea cuccullata TaxID=36930 RepID=UPI002ED1055F
MLMCDIQQACERKSTFLCKTCPISRGHLINSKEWLSFRMDADEPEEEDEEEEENLVKEKRNIYLLFDFVATKIESIFEARNLCIELPGDQFVLENDKKHLQRVLFDALVTWIERNPSMENLEILTRALQKISRCDFVDKNSLH